MVGVRRVVTGHDQGGRSCLAEDRLLTPEIAEPSGVLGFRLWGADEAPQFPDAGAQPPAGDWFPDIGGFRFIAFVLPASETVDFHRTPTLDLIYVASGEVELALDESTVLLKAGDALVQNGTNHAWRNPGATPCVLIGALVGAKRAS